MTVNIPEVDTSLNTVTDPNSMLDAPDASSQLEMPSFEEFSQNATNSAMNPNGFTQMMNQISDKAYNPQTDQWTDDGTGTATGSRASLVKYAKKFLGVNYVWGGTSPSGFDCSGLTQYVAGKFGIKLPRISADQARFGKRTSIGALQAGDLVAWDENSRNNGADHIAFYIGNGMILEAPHTGAQVRIRKLGKNEGAWGVHLNYPN